MKLIQQILRRADPLKQLSQNKVYSSQNKNLSSFFELEVKWMTP